MKGRMLMLMLITNGVKIRSMDIKNAHRLGKFSVNRASKPRPLRVTFEDKTAVGKVLRHISNLKEADEKYQRISVQREMNKDEMKQIHQKLAEAKEKNKNRQDKSLYYVVRGLPSKLEIKAVPARDEAEETAGQQREEDESLQRKPIVMKPKSIERKMRKHKIGKPKYDEANLVTTSRQQSTTINRKHMMKTNQIKSNQIKFFISINNDDNNRYSTYKGNIVMCITIHLHTFKYIYTHTYY